MLLKQRHSKKRKNHFYWYCAVIYLLKLQIFYIKHCLFFFFFCFTVCTLRLLPATIVFLSAVAAAVHKNGSFTWLSVFLSSLSSTASTLSTSLPSAFVLFQPFLVGFVECSPRLPLCIPFSSVISTLIRRQKQKKKISLQVSDVHISNWLTLLFYKS